MTRLLTVVLTVLASLFAVSGVPAAAESLSTYVGRWNYDQPDRRDGTNIATITCPAAKPGCPGAEPEFIIDIPQIGDIVLTQEAPGVVVGRTDQGCTWRFRPTARSLEIAEHQTCFNPVINSSYTITRWSITVHGRHLDETITAISHQPDGDCDFVLRNGKRTKVDALRDTTRRFVGDWTYLPPDPEKRVNVVLTRCEGVTEPTPSPQQGTVHFTRVDRDTVAARTPDGCSWTLGVRGNTALLEPSGQTCRLPDGTVRTLNHWSIASDGRQQASVMSGVDERAESRCTFILSIGSLARGAIDDRA